MINQVKNNNKVIEVKRGEIWFVDFGTTIGRTQGGRRPALIISNFKCNEVSSVVTMVALTSNVEKALQKKLPTQVFISKECGLQADSIALCEQPRSVDKSQLDFKVGEVDEATMTLIVKAVMIQVGIPITMYANNNNTNNTINNEIINMKFDMNRATELWLSVSELTKLSKQLNQPIATKDMLVKDFISYCKNCGQDYKEIGNKIKMDTAVNKRELAMC